MFRWAYDLSGNKTPQIKEIPIPTATAIELGEMVLFTPGTGVAVVAGVDFDDPALGAAMQEHAANSGESIKVSVSPTAVYALKPRVAITATGGSTTTFVDANILPAINDYFNGGYIEIVTCAADPSLVGRKLKIKDFTGAGGTITLDEALPVAIAAGDTAYLCPGPYAIGAYGWDLNADGTDINWESSGGEALQVVDVDPETFIVFVKLRLHQFGDGPLAI
jgi:hypothetical protein